MQKQEKADRHVARLTRMVFAALGWLLLLGAFGWWGTLCWCAPSIMGPTGLAVVPDAASVERGRLEVAARRVSAVNEWVTISGNVGLAEGIEVGFRWLDPDIGPSDTTLNVKTVFEPEQAGDWQVALGMWDVTDEVDRTWYAVAGYIPFPPRCRDSKEKECKDDCQNSRKTKIEKVARTYLRGQALCFGFGNARRGGRLHGGFLGFNLGHLTIDWDGEDWNTALRLGHQSGADLGWVEGDFFWGVWGRRRF